MQFFSREKKSGTVYVKSKGRGQKLICGRQDRQRPSENMPHNFPVAI